MHLTTYQEYAIIHIKIRHNPKCYNHIDIKKRRNRRNQGGNAMKHSVKRSLITAATILALLTVTACAANEAQEESRVVSNAPSANNIVNTTVINKPINHKETTDTPQTTVTPPSTSAEVTTKAAQTTAERLPAPVEYVEAEVAWGKNAYFFNKALESSELADEVKSTAFLSSLVKAGKLDIKDFETCSILYEVTNPNAVRIDYKLYPKGGYEYFSVKWHGENCRCYWYGHQPYEYECVEYIKFSAEIRPTEIGKYVPSDYKEITVDGLSVLESVKDGWTYYSPDDLFSTELRIGEYIIYAGNNVKIRARIQVAADKYDDALSSILDLCKNFAK